jgi:hypothetical protein
VSIHKQPLNRGLRDKSLDTAPPEHKTIKIISL